MTNFYVLFALVFLSSACIKTADQVSREKRFESISSQMGDTQGLLANMVTQMKEMQGQIDRLHGQIEEIEHKQSKIDPTRVNKMTEALNLLTTQQETQNTQLLQIQNELAEQREFMEKVTTTLSSMKEAPSKSKKKSAKEELTQGLIHIKNDKYSEARSILESLIDHDDLTAGDMNKLFHGLGKVEYYTKNYDKAMVYFSKIFTRYPRASLAPSSLLFIGRSLSKMGKSEEARQAFQKVMDDYKDSKEAGEAKNEL